MATKITLYYADWCGYCEMFKSEWNKLKKIISDKNLKITTMEYESKRIDQEKKDMIQGYPTIIIDKNNKKYVYNGDRTAEKIIEELVGQTVQKGGANSDYYKLKYLKYKTKYMGKKADLFY